MITPRDEEIANNSLELPDKTIQHRPPDVTLMRLQDINLDFSKYLREQIGQVFELGKDEAELSPKTMEKLFQILEAFARRLGQKHDVLMQAFGLTAEKTHRLSEEQINLYEQAFAKLILLDVLLNLGKSTKDNAFVAWGKDLAAKLTQMTVLSLYQLREVMQGAELIQQNTIDFWIDYVNRLQPDEHGVWKESVPRDPEIYKEWSAYALEMQSEEFEVQDFARYILSSLVFGDGLEGVKNLKKGRTHNLLPTRDRYYIAVVNAMTGKAVRMQFTRQEIKQRELFKAAFTVQLKSNYKSNYLEKCLTDEKSKQARIKRAYEKTPTYQQTEQRIVNATFDEDLVDLRIVIKPRRSTGNTSARVERGLDHLTRGGPRMSIEISPRMGGNPGVADGHVTMKVAHQFFDAQPSAQVLARAVGEAVKNHREYLHEQDHAKRMTHPSISPVTDLEKSEQSFLAVQPEYEPSAKFELDNQRIQEATLNWHGVKEQGQYATVFELWNKKFGIKLTSAILETYAGMMTLGIEHAHFLAFNTHHESLIPVMTIFSRSLQEKMMKGLEFTAQEKILLIMELWLMQMDKSDAESEKASGAIPAMAVFTSGVQEPITQTGKMTSPVKTEALTDTTLFSCLSTLKEFQTPYQKENPDVEIQWVSFITALAKIYRQSVATIKTDEDTTQVSLRYRTEDAKTAAVLDFERKYQQNFEHLLSALEKVAQATPSFRPVQRS